MVNLKLFFSLFYELATIFSGDIYDFYIGDLSFISV